MNFPKNAKNIFFLASVTLATVLIFKIALIVNGQTDNPPNDAGQVLKVGAGGELIITATTIQKEGANTDIILNPTGNIGIGGAWTGYKLNVNGPTPLTGHTRIDGNLLVNGIITATWGGNGITAGKVAAGVFGTDVGGGNYAFPEFGKLGVATSGDPAFLPQTFSVYGGGYFKNKVGIGIPTPYFQLEVVETGADIPAANFRNTVGAPRIAVSNGSYATVLGAGGDFGFWVESGQAIGSGINLKGTNVGIGTASPSSILELFGVAPKLKLTDTTIVNGQDWSVRAESNDFHIRDESNSFDIASFSAGGGLTFRNGGTPVRDVFKIANGAPASAFALNSSGNIGIGSSTPGTVLVAKGVITSWGEAATEQRFDLKNTGSNIHWSFGTNDAWANKGAWIFDQNGAGAVMFFQKDTGNIGIGTIEPDTSKLKVVGMVESTTGGFKFPDGTTQTTAAGGGSQWTTNGNDIYYNTGKVGIGTNTPQEKLHVAGNLRLGGDPSITWTGNNLDLKSAGSSIGVVRIRGEGANTPRLEVYNADNTSVALYVRGDGYVGVGAASVDTNYKITTSGGGIKADSGSQPAGYFSSVSGYGLIVNSGNVGIGTTSPGEKLEVRGGLIKISAATGEVRQDLKIDTSAHFWSFGTNDGWAENGAWIFEQGQGAAGAVIFFKPGGNVGIGTTNPGTYKLNVAAGYVNSVSGYCINGANCISSWPAAGAVSSVSNSDGTLIINPTTGAVVASLALGHANTWTGAQTFNGGAGFPSNGIWDTNGRIGINSAVDTTYRITTAGGGIKAKGATSGNSEYALYLENSNSNGLFAVRNDKQIFINNVSYAWPASQGGASTYLKNDGGGNLSWGTVSGGISDAFSSIADGNGTIIFSATGADKLSVAAGAGMSVIFDPPNKKVTFTNTGDLSTTNEIQDVIANQGLRRDASKNFGLYVCSDNEILKYDGGTSSWGCEVDATGGGAVSSVSNSDGTLTINPTIGAVLASLALGHANSWSATQTFSNTTYQALFTGTGNVGIGTATPGASLEVSKTIGRILISSTLSGNSAGLRLSAYSGTTNRMAGYYFVPGSTDATTYLALAADDGAGQLVVTRAGNVGIGTTGPQNKLDIEGSAVIGATYSGTNAGPSNGLLVEGDVGIGTTNPFPNKLRVMGSAYFSDYIFTNNFIQANTGGTFSAANMSSYNITLPARDLAGSTAYLYAVKQNCASGDVQIAVHAGTSVKLCMHGASMP